MTTRSERFFVEPEEVESLGFDWGLFTTTCSPELNNAQGFSTGLVVMKPRQGHGRHNHPAAEEIIFVISGRGEQMVEDDKGNPIVQEIGPGSTVYVPKDRFHYTLNIGDEPMKVFVVYSPPGSEQDLAKQPGCNRLPPMRPAHLQTS
jgi:oxalate decarboxylase/phosphoglucose isomerase-like protein (cupin superfamily)